MGEEARLKFELEAEREETLRAEVEAEIEAKRKADAAAEFVRLKEEEARLEFELEQEREAKLRAELEAGGSPGVAVLKVEPCEERQRKRKSECPSSYFQKRSKGKAED